MLDDDERIEEDVVEVQVVRMEGSYLTRLRPRDLWASLRLA